MKEQLSPKDSSMAFFHRKDYKKTKIENYKPKLINNLFMKTQLFFSKNVFPATKLMQTLLLTIFLLVISIGNTKASHLDVYMDVLQESQTYKYCRTGVDSIILHKPAGVIVDHWVTNFAPYTFIQDSIIIPNSISPASITCYFPGGTKTVILRFVDPLQDPMLQDQIQCGRTPITLSGGGSVYQYPHYSWSTGDTTKTITVNVTGSYTVQVSNICNTVTSTANLTFVYVDAELCGASFEPLSQKNKLTWDGSNLQGKFAILLKRNLSNVLVAVDTVPFTNGEWIDYASVPQNEENGYAMMVWDTCNNVSDTSTEHITIWLQISSYQDEVYYEYTPYQGAVVSTYTLYGIKNNGTVDSLISKAATFLNMLLPDSVATNYQKFFIGFPLSCGGTKGIINVKSNIVSGLSSMDETENIAHMIIYPNPTTDILNISGRGYLSLSIIDMMGRTVMGNTTQRNIDVSALAPGIYGAVIKTRTGGIGVRLFNKE